MTLHTWAATWLEIAHLVTDHIGEGLAIAARVIDPPPEVPQVEEAARAWIVVAEEFCDDCNVTHEVRRLYTQTGDEEPMYRGQASDHQEEL